MSLNFNTLAPVTFNNGLGQKPASQSVAYCRPVDETKGPTVVEITIPWTAAPYNVSDSKRDVAIRLNLVAQQVATPLDAIRSIKIDNSFCDATLYVQFSDTYDTIVCPPNSVLIAPVATGSQEIIIYGTGFFSGRAPQTTFVFCNYPQPASVVFSGIGYQLEASLGAIFTQYALNTAYSFPAHLGQAYPARLIAGIAFGIRSAAGANTIPNLITVNGVNITANIVNSANVTITSGGLARSLNISEFYGLVPSNAGFSATVQYPNQQLAFGAALWVINNYTQAAPFSTDIGVTSTGTASGQTAAVQVLPGGVSVGCGFSYTNSATPFDIEIGGDNVQFDGQDAGISGANSILARAVQGDFDIWQLASFSGECHAMTAMSFV